MSLLPRLGSADDATQDGDVRLLGVDDEEADAVFDALSSATARTLLAAAYEEPRTPSALAAHADTTVQNALYHLDTLDSLDLVAVVGTQYSEKGAEMDVYGPPDNPKVVFVGTEDRRSRFRQLLERLVGSAAVLLLASVAFHVLVAGVPFGGQQGAGGPSAPTGVPAGAAFLLGGLCTLAVLAVGWRFADRLGALRAHALFGGRDAATTRRFLGVAAVVSAAGACYWALQPLLAAPSTTIGPVPLWLAGLAAVTVLGAVQASVNDGLFVTWAVVGLPVASFAGYALGLAAESGVGDAAGAALTVAVLGAAVGGPVVGTAAFLAGAGARRAVAALGGPRQSS